MNWKAILNPWGEVKRLQSKVDNLNGQLDALEDRLDRAEQDAWRRMAVEFEHRNRHVIAQNEVLMGNAIAVGSMQPVPYFAPPEWITKAP